MEEEVEEVFMMGEDVCLKKEEEANIYVERWQKKRE